MKQFLGVVLLTVSVTTPAFAQIPAPPVPPCGGTISIPNSLSAMGSNGWMVYTISTIINVNLCVASVSVSGSVSGIPNSSASETGTWTASVRKEVPAPRPDTYVANGVHKYVWFFPFGIFGVETALSQSSATVRWEDEPPNCEALNGGGNYYVWDPVIPACVEFMGTPIVVDTGGNGYQFTSARDGVWFDINGDGRPRQIAWTRRGAENAFLALDRNENGVIDDGTELFGNRTPVEGGTAPNGFEALRFSESLLAVDGYITDRDPAFSRLLLWTDRNHNGTSEPEELQSVSEAGVAGISLDYKSTRRQDRYGNEFRQAGKLTWTDRRASTNIFDIWFRTQ